MEIKNLERDFIEQKIKDNLLLIGKNHSEIQKKEESNLSLTMDAIKNYQMNSKEPIYPCTASIAFTICHGHLTVNVTFGDKHNWEFQSTFWGFGLNFVSGSGFSVWAEDFIAPSEGERMNFEIVSASATFGCIQIFFWPEGSPIIGGFTIGAGGAGLLGGGGTGTWKRK